MMPGPVNPAYLSQPAVDQRGSADPVFVFAAKLLWLPDYSRIIVSQIWKLWVQRPISLVSLAGKRASAVIRLCAHASDEFPESPQDGELQMPCSLTFSFVDSFSPSCYALHVLIISKPPCAQFSFASRCLSLLFSRYDTNNVSGLRFLFDTRSTGGGLQI
jgi:hypothetical protein